MTTYGALFAGYGGLELGVQSVLGGHLSWYAEIDPAPSRVMAHHYPGVPNLGDVTKVDWTTVESVDVLRSSVRLDESDINQLLSSMRAVAS